MYRLGHWSVFVLSGWVENTAKHLSTQHQAAPPPKERKIKHGALCFETETVLHAQEQCKQWKVSSEQTNVIQHVEP